MNKLDKQINKCHENKRPDSEVDRNWLLKCVKDSQDNFGT
jgi:hypothetical protein